MVWVIESNMLVIVILEVRGQIGRHCKTGGAEDEILLSIFSLPRERFRLYQHISYDPMISIGNDIET